MKEAKKFASNQVSIGGEIIDNFSFGHSINGSIRSTDPSTIFLSHLRPGALPVDLEQGVYFLFTAKDVGFTQAPDYCAYHAAGCALTNSDSAIMSIT